jgi:hypothetical protein
MIGYGSDVINGQLVQVAEAQAFNPLAYGSVLSGPGFWPRGGQYNVPPLLPSSTAMSGSTDYTPDFTDGSFTAGGTAGPSAGAVSSSGKVNWLHPTKSPVLWAVGCLAISLLLLHKIHYK